MFETCQVFAFCYSGKAVIHPKQCLVLTLCPVSYVSEEDTEVVAVGHYTAAFPFFSLRKCLGGHGQIVNCFYLMWISRSVVISYSSHCRAADASALLMDS